MLYLIRGIPGSGKTTLAQSMLSVGLVDRHFEADQFMVNEFGEYCFNPSKLKDCHKACLDRTAAHLRAGQSVVVANTFVRKREMDEYLSLAKKDIGVLVTILVCQGEYKSLHNVPRATIERMRERFEY